MTKNPVVMKFAMPFSADVFGRWLEEHGACVTISCSLGSYDVSIDMKKLHSFDDEHGEHSERWSVSRRAKTLPEALSAAFAAAQTVRS